MQRSSTSDMYSITYCYQAKAFFQAEVEVRQTSNKQADC